MKIVENELMPFEELFFHGTFNTLLSKERAGNLLLPLEMGRLAPSAVNKQPWRVIITSNFAHFYLKRNKGFSHGDKLDMQMIDMGIALCHFSLTAREAGLILEFAQNNPNLTTSSELEYVASYMLK